MQEQNNWGLEQSLMASREEMRKVIKPLETRKKYRDLYQWSHAELKKFEAQMLGNQDSEAIAGIVQEQKKVVVSMLLQITRLAKEECLEKGCIIDEILSHALKVMNQHQKYYEMVTYNQISRFRDSIEDMQKQYSEKTQKFVAEIFQLNKQKDNKWKNTYMLIKDNRVIRKQNNKLQKRLKEEIWKTRNLEEDVMNLRISNERYQLMCSEEVPKFTHLKGYIKNQILFMNLENLIKKYPGRAKRILKQQLGKIQTYELQTLESKINFITHSLETNGQVCEELDDWDHTIQNAKFLFSISTQTENQTQQIGVNTIVQAAPQKICHTYKTQVRPQDCMKLQKFNLIDVQIYPFARAPVIQQQSRNMSMTSRFRQNIPNTNLQRASKEKIPRKPGGLSFFTFSVNFGDDIFRQDRRNTTTTINSNSNSPNNNSNNNNNNSNNNNYYISNTYEEQEVQGFRTGIKKLGRHNRRDGNIGITAGIGGGGAEFGNIGENRNLRFVNEVYRLYYDPNSKTNGGTIGNSEEDPLNQLQPVLYLYQRVNYSKQQKPKSHKKSNSIFQNHHQRIPSICHVADPKTGNDLNSMCIDAAEVTSEYSIDGDGKMSKYYKMDNKVIINRRRERDSQLSQQKVQKGFNNTPRSNSHRRQMTENICTQQNWKKSSFKENQQQKLKEDYQQAGTYKAQKQRMQKISYLNQNSINDQTNKSSQIPVLSPLQPDFQKKKKKTITFNIEEQSSDLNLTKSSRKQIDLNVNNLKKQIKQDKLNQCQKQKNKQKVDQPNQDQQEQGQAKPNKHRRIRDVVSQGRENFRGRSRENTLTIMQSSRRDQDKIIIRDEHLVMKVINSMFSQSKNILQSPSSFSSYAYQILKQKFQNKNPNYANHTRLQYKFFNAIKNYISYPQSSIFINLLLEKLIANTRCEIFAEDMFILFAKMITKLNSFGLVMTSQNVQYIPYQYGIKTLQYLCSVFLSPKQTQEFMKQIKSKYGNRNHVNMIDGFLRLFNHLERLVFESQLWNFMSNACVWYIENITQSEIREICTLFGLLTTRTQMHFQRISYYANKYFPLHRFCLYAHRFEWREVYYFTSWLDLKHKEYLEKVPYSSIHQALPSLKSKLQYRGLNSLASLLESTGIRCNNLNTMLNSELMKLCQLTVVLLEVDDHQVFPFNLSLFQTVYRGMSKKMVKLENAQELLPEPKEATASCVIYFHIVTSNKK